MKQLELWAAAGTVARDAAIDRVEDNADTGWLEGAMIAVREVARRMPEFTTDHVWLSLSRSGGGAISIEPRAMGAVMRAAASDGVVEPVDRWELSQRPACHRRPVRVWRSLICR